MAHDCDGPFAEVNYPSLGVIERSCGHGWRWFIRRADEPVLAGLTADQRRARVAKEREQRRARRALQCRYCAATLDGTPCSRHGGPTTVERNRVMARTNYHRRKNARRALAGA